MKSKNCFMMVAVIVAAILCWGSLALAGDYQLTLTPSENEPGASGTVIMSATDLSIEAGGLHPNSVYTVWFVNMVPTKTETGAGQAPYKFETDEKGNGVYVSPLDEDPMGKWQMIMVVLHPDGDPMNMKTMVGALSAEIPAELPKM